MSIAMVIALIKSFVKGGGGGGGGGAVDDVKVNGTSVVTNGVANIPHAGDNTLGLVKARNWSNRTNALGIYVNDQTGDLGIIYANDAEVKAGISSNRVITPSNQDKALFYGLSKLAGENLNADTVTVGTYPEKSKSAISDMLNAPETVSGTTPSITAKPGIRYVCGEVSTLTVVVPASGIIDVVFESGSTPTVLTVTPPTGVSAVKWANGFNPASLEANTVYELNIANGEYGVACEWT
jgi:hypothetical protein